MPMGGWFIARKENIGFVATGPILPKRAWQSKVDGANKVPWTLLSELNGGYVLDINNQLYPLLTMVKTMMHIIHRRRKQGKYSEPRLYQMDSERMWHNLVEYIFLCSVYLLDKCVFNVLTSYSWGNRKLNVFYLQTISDNPYKKGIILILSGLRDYVQQQYDLKSYSDWSVYVCGEMIVLIKQWNGMLPIERES